MPTDRPDEGLRAQLRALSAEWRRKAEQHNKHGDCYRKGEGWGLTDCATALDTLLAQASAEPSEGPDKKTTGLYNKFNVTRTDGQSAKGRKHDGCRYFVLDATHDPHAPAALRAYAASCEGDYPLLAADVRSLAGSSAVPLPGAAAPSEDAKLSKESHRKQSIWKYELAVADEEQVVSMPEAATVLSVQMQRDTLTIWALVYPDAKRESRQFRIYGTGHQCDLADYAGYVGTVQMHGGALVWHVFEATR